LLSKIEFHRSARLACTIIDEDRTSFQCESSVFMRVRRTVPQFTFSLSVRFVNHISSVSTGFFRFLSVLFENGYISPLKPNKNATSDRASVLFPKIGAGSAAQQFLQNVTALPPSARELQ
jgi:hypothetical protein